MKSSRKHVIGLSMRSSLTLCAIGVLLALSSCGSEAFTPESKRANAIKTFKLTPAQTEIMDAYFEGMTQQTAEGKFTRRWTRISACYAARVDIDPRFESVHKDYIRDFVSIERDYYPWFARRGVSENEAYELGQKVKATSDFCHKTVAR